MKPVLPYRVQQAAVDRDGPVLAGEIGCDNCVTFITEML
jgi:hypothetical protein